jgi:hypothetical protein
VGVNWKKTQLFKHSAHASTGTKPEKELKMENLMILLSLTIIALPGTLIGYCAITAYKAVFGK